MLKCLFISMLIIGGNAQHTRRTLLLFADNDSQNILKKQQMLLQMDKQGLQRRDLDIKVFSTANAAQWKQNHVRNGFTMILIGKDGGEKLRSHKPVTTSKLFEIIDVMPMRKEEISHAGGYE